MTNKLTFITYSLSVSSGIPLGTMVRPLWEQSTVDPMQLQGLGHRKEIPPPPKKTSFPGAATASHVFRVKRNAMATTSIAAAVALEHIASTSNNAHEESI